MHVKVLDEDVVERAKARDIDALVYAPHFTRLPTIRERAARFSDDELLVVPAREVFTGPWYARRHLLAIGLEDPVPDFVSFEGALAAFDRQDAAVLVPHPEMLNVSCSRAEVAAHADAVHAVETYNAKCLPPQNRRCRAVARETGLPGFGSSYAHLRRTVGEVWTRFEDPLDSEAALVEALRTGAPRRVVHRGGADHHLRGLAEFAHLGVENTWGKLDRLFLSGTEPTHPRHIAYDGRFDDVAVY
ncbi:PHP domain-containing protein [Haloplanus rallus]|jgi:predicted metal-dependent phosphoesterase TrpH|uniref:PHP domain-containing protein n=1 Tax=Haloplanus rallus TaxID=1816183 RepID=A0A6B9FC78_9EURY|nr:MULTISPECIES: PHP-associated domain-containing protein [Haloplanus]QGX96627.1 PHP domain-containing protein [Haloplanus rallus]